MATQTQTVTQTRAMDHAYDPVYTVSSSRDFPTASVQQTIQPVPQNMFSDLKHYPRATMADIRGMQNRPQAGFFHVKHAGGELAGDRRVASGDIGGRLRYKYFRRPMVPYLQSVPPDVLLARETDVAAAPPPVPEPASKTVATQSDYRESEAQTDPYTPDYTVRPGSAPEILTLVSLAWGSGLPAGLAEVEMIERARQKRAFEASLPPIDANDPSSFERRRNLMAEQELKEWEEREKEIEAIEGARLELIRRALEQRDGEKDRANFQRLEHTRQMRVAEKDKFLSSIHKRRLRALRKLTESRKHQVEKPAVRDIIEDYSNFNSKVYAPITREGNITDKNPARFEAKPDILSSLEGLMELEASLPRSVTTASVVKPNPKRRAKNPEARKTQALAKHLAYMDGAIQKKKDAAAGLGVTSQNRVDRYAVVKPLERPPIPEVMAPPEDEEADVAAGLLQRLVRGRAVQNRMFAGKEKRAELIKELRLDEVLVEMKDELALAEAASAQRDFKTAAVNSSIAAAQGEMVGATLQYLSAELVRLREERSIQAMAMIAERTRRMREAVEAGTREKELAAREVEQDRYRAVMRIRQGTVDKFLEEVVTTKLEALAENTATHEALLKAERINEVVDKLEERYNRPQVIVQDLMASFLLPEVDRQLAREDVAIDQAKISLAVRDALAETVDAVRGAEGGV